MPVTVILLHLVLVLSMLQVVKTTVPLLVPADHLASVTSPMDHVFVFPASEPVVLAHHLSSETDNVHLCDAKTSGDRVT